MNFCFGRAIAAKHAKQMLKTRTGKKSLTDRVTTPDYTQYNTYRPTLVCRAAPKINIAPALRGLIPRVRKLASTAIGCARVKSNTFSFVDNHSKLGVDLSSDSHIVVALARSK